MGSAPGVLRPTRISRRRLLFGTVGSAASLALIIGLQVVAGGLTQNLALAMAAFALAAVLFALPNVGVSLVVLALYLGLLDGFLKLRSGSQTTTLGRDLLLYAIAAGAFLRLWMSHEPIRRPPLFGLILLWVVVVLISVINPNVVRTSHALAGIRPHIEFVPLFFLGYAVMRTKGAIRTFLYVLLIVAAVNGVVGFIQNNLSPDQLAAWGPGYAQRVYGTGAFQGAGGVFSDATGAKHIRPFALGSDVGFGGIMGVIAISAAAALLVARPRGRTLAIVSVLTALTVLAVVTSQTRIAVVGAVAALFGFSVINAVSRNAIRTILLSGVVFGIVYITLSLATQADPQLLGRYSTIAPNRVVSSATKERGGSFTGIVTQAVRYPFGFGTGTVGPGAGALSNNPEQLTGENEPAYLGVEVGIQGQLVLLAIAGCVLFWALTRIRRIRDRELRLLLSGLSGALIGLTVVGLGGAVTSGTPGSPYLWFTAGTLAWWLSARPRELAAASR